MIAKIRNHISVFGDKFIVAEFGSVALVIGGVAIFFLVKAQFVLAFIAAGITLNCLPMLAYGIRALVNKETRSSARPDEKQTLKDTFALSTALNLPFVLLAATAYEKWHEDREHKS